MDQNILIYTFSTFPLSSELEKLQIFKFHNLKKDMEEFKSLIKQTNPKLIIGFALSRTKSSFFETKSINVFNKSKKINQKGRDFHFLDYPQEGFLNIKPHLTPTDTFCNWTMYKVMESIENTNTKFQFIHVSKENISTIHKYLQKSTLNSTEQ